MREIKFRARDKSSKEYEYITDLYWFEENQVHGFDDPSYDFEQFTGLRDKNGVEIYEGDTVKSNIHNPGIMGIRFVEGGFCAWWGDDDYPIDINHFYDSKGCCIEVIGNIHENPELIDKEVSS